MVVLMVGLTSGALMAAVPADPAQSASDAAYTLGAGTNHDNVGAQAAYEKVLKDYPAASAGSLGDTAKSIIASCLEAQGKHAESQAAFEKILKDNATRSAESRWNVVQSLDNIVAPAVPLLFEN